MKLALAFLLVFAALFMPVSAYAETISWDAADDGGIPKGIVGHDGIACIGTATQGGNTIHYTNYVGADAGWMSTQPDRERNWQTNFCRYMLETDLPMMFKWYWNIDLDKSNIKMTIKRL